MRICGVNLQVNFISESIEKKHNLEEKLAKKSQNQKIEKYFQDLFMRVIILENIRSLNNVWAIFRTADGAGFDRVCLVGYTPTPPREEITKTALWAENSVPWEYFVEIKDAIEHYKKNDCPIIVLEKNTISTDLFDLPKIESVALIVWNELEWVSEIAQKMADHICHLPMFGVKESLNVAVAAGIGMYSMIS
jgi:23S rRNA (guanosine2251-2'-O)-methyltransferase